MSSPEDPARATTTRLRVPMQLANYFITLEPGISHLKLQKLAYCAYGWFFVMFPDERETAIVDEKIQAWDFGPVFQTMYKNLRRKEFEQESPFYRAPVEDYDITALGETYFSILPDDEDESIRGLLNWVSKRYRKYSGVDMVGLTHRKPSPERKGSPWDRVAAEYVYALPRGKEIPDDYIREEFLSLAGKK